MKKILLLRILLGGFVLFNVACNKNTNTATDTAAVPELLQRPESIRQGKEWDEVQSFYAENLNRLRKNPQDQTAFLNLSELFLQEARVTGESTHYYTAALQMLDRILPKPVDKDLEFRALAHKASIMLSLHQFQMALETAQKAISINPHNAQIYGVLVDANVELGNYEAAVATADQMVSMRPDLRSYSRVSYLRQIHGDNKGAIEAMAMATEAGYPGAEDTEWSRVTLGDLLLNTGDLDNAEAMYQMALTNRPQYPYAEMGLAKVAKARRAYDQAIAHTENAIRTMSLPGFVDMLADLYELKGEVQKAQEIRAEIVELLQKAEKEEPKNTSVRHNGAREMAMAYLKNKELDQALALAQTDLQMRPANIEANELVAWIYYLQGNYAKAQEHADKMLKTNVKNVNTLYKASLIYEKAGATAQAERYAAEAKKCSPYVDELLTKAQGMALN